MPVRRDAVTTATHNVTPGVVEIIWSHTCSGDDRYLIVTAYKAFGADLAAEYNGVAMTELSNVEAGGISVFTFGMANPPAGAHDVRVYLPGGGATFPTATAASYTGVDLTSVPTTATTSSGTGTVASINSTLAVGDLGITVIAAQNDATTITLDSDWTTEIARLDGGAGETNSCEMVVAEQWGKDITLDATLSASTDWQMATVALKPATPPRIYTALMFSPQSADTTGTLNAGTVVMDAATEAAVLAEANTLTARMLTYSDGMGALDVTPLIWAPTVDSTIYTEKTSGTNTGWYHDPVKVRDYLISQSVDVDYDVLVVYSDTDQVTLDASDLIGISRNRAWWGAADSDGFHAGPHEFAHVLEDHLRTHGYSNFPSCAGNPSSDTIHCAEEYGYSSSISDDWLHAWFSGTAVDSVGAGPDNTGVNATGWAIPTLIEYAAQFGADADVTDTFTDTAGTVLNDHAPDIGGVWEQIDSNTQVITPAGRLRTTGTSGTSPSVYRNLAATTNADVSVAMDVVVTDTLASPAVGPCARMDTWHETKFYHARLNPGGDDVQLYRFHDALGNTLLGSAPWVRVTGQTYRLELICEGDSIRVRLDDVTVIDVTDSSIPDAGYVGFRALGQATDTTGLHIDNVRAELPAVAIAGAVTAIATSDATANATLTQAASVTMTATSEATAHGTITDDDANPVMMTATSTASATATLTQTGSLTAVATSDASATGTLAMSVTGSMTAIATSDASATATIKASITGSVTITATSSMRAIGTVVLSPDVLPDPVSPRTLTWTVRIDGIVTSCRSCRTIHDVDQPKATGSVTLPGPLPLHVQSNAPVTIHAGWDGDALPIFDGRIPDYDGTFNERGGEVTVQLEGQSQRLFHSHPTWLGYQGPESLATYWRSVMAYVGMPHFYADDTLDANGNNLMLGTVNELNNGLILIDTRSSPGADLSRIARLFGYRQFDTPLGVRLQRISGLPTDPVESLLTYEEGVNCRSIERRESLDPMINWWDVWGATYTAADTSEVVIHSAPASVTPDDRLGPYGIARDEVRDSALDTIALADACRNAHEVDFSEPYMRWRWTARGDAARIPGEQVALSSPKVGPQVEILGVQVSFPVGCWLMRVEHDIGERGWTTSMEGWQGAGEALPTADDCTTETLLGSGGVHLGNQTVGYYRNPSPNGNTSGTEHRIAFSVVNPYTTLTIRGWAHGTNNFAGGQNSTASRFEIWQDGARVASGDLPVTGEDGGADYDQDAPWHQIVIPLSGSLLAGSAELRIIAGEDTDVGDVDDMELRDCAITYCGIGAPGTITEEAA